METSKIIRRQFDGYQGRRIVPYRCSGVRRGLKEIPEGAILEIIGNHDGIRADLIALVSRSTGKSLIGDHRNGEFFNLFVQKGGGGRIMKKKRFYLSIWLGLAAAVLLGVGGPAGAAERREGPVGTQLLELPQLRPGHQTDHGGFSVLFPAGQSVDRQDRSEASGGQGDGPDQAGKRRLLPGSDRGQRLEDRL